jgi:hypothetical protein
MKLSFANAPWPGGEPILALFWFVFSIAGYFAAGGSIFLVLLERKAHRERNQNLLSFLQDWSRFFLLLTVILGGGSAVGGWIAQGVISPSATLASSGFLLWVWGTVWVLTAVQLAAALLYHSGWGVTAPVHHRVTGLIFSAAAWGSLFILSGIMARMTGPGDPGGTCAISPDFFGENFSPLLLENAGLALGLGGLFSLVGGAGAELRLRSTLVRHASGFVVAGFALWLIGLGWHVLILPDAARHVLLGPVSPSTLLFTGSLALSVILIASVLTGPMSRPEGCTTSFALLLLVMGLVVAFAGMHIRISSRPHYGVAIMSAEAGPAAAGRTVRGAT